MIYSTMLRRITLIGITLVAAFTILFVTALRTASVKYEFSGAVINQPPDGHNDSQESIDYIFPFPGKILPDSPLWVVKASRDRAWLMITTNPNREAELLLLFADKRLVASQRLFERGKPELGLTTLLKAEEYLYRSMEAEKKSRDLGMETSELLNRIALASLKHREIIELVIIPLAPTDAKPDILHTTQKTNDVFSRVSQAMHEEGIEIPYNPFNGSN